MSNKQIQFTSIRIKKIIQNKDDIEALWRKAKKT